MTMNKKTSISIGNTTVETRESRRIWLGKGLSGLMTILADKTPQPDNGEGFLLPVQGVKHPWTAMGIKMGEESQYREALEGDRDYAQRRTGHPTHDAYYATIKYLPRHKGVIQGANEHVKMLEMLDRGNAMYYTGKDEIFVGDWNIATPELYHRHKELGTYSTMDDMSFKHISEIDVMDADHWVTYVQWDAAGGLCGLCREQMPGEVMMMHKFYQF